MPEIYDSCPFQSNEFPVHSTQPISSYTHAATTKLLELKGKTFLVKTYNLLTDGIILRLCLQKNCQKYGVFTWSDMFQDMQTN